MQRVAAGKPVTPTFLFALLLYGPIAEIIEKQPQEKWHDIGTIVDAVDRAAREAQGRISIPKRFSLGVREMFAAQPRLEQPRGRRALRMLEQPRFRAGFDLLLLRAEMGLAPRGDRRLVDARAGGLADGSRSHGRCAGAATASGGRRRAAAAAAAAAVAGVAGAARGRPERRGGRACTEFAGSRPTSAWAAISPIRARRCARRSRRWRGCRARGCVAVARRCIARAPLGAVAQPAFVNAVAGLLTQL